MTFENDLLKVFDNAIDVNDTIWYSEFETLYDRILDVFDQYRYDILLRELHVKK